MNVASVSLTGQSIVTLPAQAKAKPCVIIHITLEPFQWGGGGGGVPGSLNSLLTRAGQLISCMKQALINLIST